MLSGVTAWPFVRCVLMIKTLPTDPYYIWEQLRAKPVKLDTDERGIIRCSCGRWRTVSVSCEICASIEKRGRLG